MDDKKELSLIQWIIGGVLSMLAGGLLALITAKVLGML